MEERRAQAIRTSANFAPTDMNFQEVTQERWGDLESLFEGRGGPSHCWCMVWRPKPKGGGGRLDNAAKKIALRGFVDAGTPVGLLGYEGGEPVAWCSIAPRDAYRRMSRIPDPDGIAPADVWAVACFFAVRRLRGTGITRRLIAAAVSLARSKGAAMVEAYPVDPDSPSYKFMGTVPAFQSMGFECAGAEGKRRRVMRFLFDKRREKGDERRADTTTGGRRLTQ